MLDTPPRLAHEAAADSRTHQQQGAMVVAPSVDAVLGDKNLVKSIFDQLALPEIVNAAATCRLFNEVANHDDFWKQIDFRGKRVLPEHAAALLRRHPRVEELDLSGLDGSLSTHPSQAGGALSIPCFVEQVAPHLTNLRKLKFSARPRFMDSIGPLCPVAAHLVAQLSSFSSLTCLCLSGMRIVNGSGVHGDLVHPELRRLILDDTESSGLTVRCPELTFLSMAGAANTRMPNLDEAPALAMLDLSRCSKLAEASTRATLMRLTSLRELSVSGISHFLDQTVQHLATSLERLTRLDMSRVTGISFQGVRGFAALQHLDISRCDQLNTGALVAALETFECLERLVMNGSNMVNVKFSLPKLKDLSMRGCPNLSELEVRAWQLTRLDLGPAEGSGQANQSLAKLTVTSGALRRMEWNKLNKLSTVDLDCPTLTELVVRDCDFLEASVLQNLGDTASAPVFKSGVFEAARRTSAPLGTKPALASTPGFSTGLGRGAGDVSDQGRMGWMAPLTEDDDSYMHDLLLGEGAQPPGGDEDGTDDTDDDADDGGPDHRGAGRAGGSGFWQRRAPPVASQMLLAGMPEGREEGWQGPGRLLRERVGFGAAGPMGRRAGSSSSAAAAAAAGGRQPLFGDAGAGSSAAAGSAGAGPSGSRGQGAAVAEAAPSPAAAAASMSDAAAGSQQAQTNGVSDSLGLGFDWLWAGMSNSRGLLPDRCFVWGSSGDRLQQVAQAQGQQGPAAPANAAAAAAAAGSSAAAAAGAEGPEPARAREEDEDEDTSDFARRKAQRLEGSGARLPRAPAGGAAGAASSQSPQQPQQAAPRQQQQQNPQPRRRQRMGAVAGSLARHQARRRAMHEASGSQSSLSAAAAAAAAGADDEGWSDVPSVGASPAQLCRQAGLARRAAGPDGGGDGDSSSSSDMDADADMGRAPAAAGGALPRLRGSIRPGKGGVPRLRVLHVEGCDRLQELQLSHLALEQVVVAGCNSMVVLALHAPKLTALELQELGDLKGACLQEVCVPSITMGSCSSLQGIELSSKVTVRLDVRGCGGLQQLHLDCPALQVLDANFCGSLSDEGLAAAVANTPPLRQLALSVCCQVGSAGLSSLSRLTTLQQLDLSYTEVSTLQPILESCPHLQSLSIASCRSLGKDALRPLLDPQQPALSQLTSLDASYCDVEDQLLAELLLRCRKLRHLALSGCAGVTDAVWQQVEGPKLQRATAGRGTVAGSAPTGGTGCAAAAAAEGAALMEVDGDGQDSSQQAASEAEPGSGSQLESLSLVRCSNLRSLCLGLLPASGQVELLPPKHYLLSAGRAALQAVAAGPDSWVEVPSTVSQLTSLKVGLSGVQVVALSLPRLAHLDLSSCKHLRVLELRCPLLLQLQLQACRALPVASALRGVLGAPRLQMLDVQHMLPQPAASSAPSDGDSACGAGAGLEGSDASMETDRAPAGDAAAGSLLAAVAATGVLPPPSAGHGTEAQVLDEILQEVAATHASLGAGGILRCTSLCKVCSKLSQCSL